MLAREVSQERLGRRVSLSLSLQKKKRFTEKGMQCFVVVIGVVEMKAERTDNKVVVKNRRNRRSREEGGKGKDD